MLTTFNMQSQEEANVFSFTNPAGYTEMEFSVSPTKSTLRYVGAEVARGGTPELIEEILPVEIATGE